MISVRFRITEEAIDRLAADIMQGRITSESDARNFRMWGKLNVAVDGRELFSPPIWPSQVADIGQVADVALLDYFYHMADIVRQLSLHDPACAVYYFVDLDYVMRFERSGRRVSMTGIEQAGDYPTTPTLDTSLEEFKCAVSCAAKDFLSTICSRRPEIRTHRLTRDLISRIRQLSTDFAK